MSENTDQSGGGSPFSDDAENEVVQQVGRTDKDGASVGHFTLTPATDTRSKELLCDVRPIIPVIFLPGVMGSPLVNAETGDEIFFAPETDGLLGKAGALPALIGMWFKGASTREKLFDPTLAAVTPSGLSVLASTKTMTTRASTWTRRRLFVEVGAQCIGRAISRCWRGCRSN